MIPEQFILRMRRLLGEDYDAFAASFSRPRAVGLRLNPLKGTSLPDLSAFSLAPVPWAPCGYYYDPETRPGKSAYHEAGLYYLQEASAMRPRLCLTRSRASGCSIFAPRRAENPRSWQGKCRGADFLSATR